MKLRSLFLLLICIIFSFGACSSLPTNKIKIPKEAPVRIANDSLEYEIMIIDIGFTAYLASTAKPKGFYTQEYMENRNSVWVASWNSRAQSPIRTNHQRKQFIQGCKYKAGIIKLIFNTLNNRPDKLQLSGLFYSISNSLMEI